MALSLRVGRVPECCKGNCRGVPDVQRVDGAAYRDTHVHIGIVERCLREARSLGAEQQRNAIGTRCGERCEINCIG